MRTADAGTLIVTPGVHLPEPPAKDTAQRWQTRLAAGDVVILDGGTGSEFTRRGVALDAAAWSAIANISHTGLLTDIHCDYLAAGADVITANTFAGSRFVLEAAGLKDRFSDVNGGAMKAALRARERAGRADAAIAASLSCLPPRFDPNAWPDSASELAAYRELVSLFVNEGADLIILEMMQEPHHARLAAEAAADSGLPVWLGLSCRVNAAGELTGYDFSSRSLDTTLDSLLAFDFALVAVMHSPVSAILPALQHLRSRSPTVLGAWAEIGTTTDLAPDDRTARTAADSTKPESDPLTAVGYAQVANDWVLAGAQVVGGCCGTTPAHIAALRARWPARDVSD